MPWFAVRSVYLFGRKSDGVNIFEERIVCFEAQAAEVALEKGVAESKQYAADNELVAFPERDAYGQDGEPLIEGYELWSVLFESRDSLEDFYAARYTKYDYHPE